MTSWTIMSEIPHTLRDALAGRYRIERELGRGGTATVYLGEDIRHGRRVALKVLRPELVAVIGVERFLLEIKTTANLNHPHILPLFDSGEAEGSLYYVMPYVQGESLRARLKREKQLSIPEAIGIATGVAEALEYAHRHDVIHRDIKPGNILFHDGRPMVTDFGIALAVSTAAGERITETGLSIGTPHYMSPEQATAEKSITHRTDIYSLGVVLYEMLTGEPPHTGSAAPQILAKILLERPRPVTELRKSVPPNVAGAVSQSLEKLPADRFESAKAFAEALTTETFVAASKAGEPHRAEPRRARAGGIRLTHTIVIAALAGVAAWGWLRPRLPPRDVDRLAVMLEPDQELHTYAWTSPVAISPDGRTLAFSASEGGTPRLYRRALGDFDAKELPGTEGAHSPFFSPDGQWIGYLSDNQMWKVSVTGGTPVPLCDVSDERLGAAWDPGGTIVFGDKAGLMRVDEGGGTPQLVRPLRADSGETALGFPQVLPDERILLTVFAGPGGTHAEILDADGKRSHVVLDHGVGAQYLPSGYLLYAQSGILRVVAFDLRRLRIGSKPIPVPEPVSLTPPGNPALSVSTDGTLVYVPAGERIESDVFGEAGTLVRVGPEGDETTLWQHWAGLVPRISPDGTRVVAALPADPAKGRGNFHVWVYDLQRRTRQKLTTEGTNVFPIWTPDGRHITFSSNRAGAMSLYWMLADGSGDPEPLLLRDGEQFATSWSPDGQLLAYEQRDVTTRFDISLLRMDGSREPSPFVQTPANETGLVFSPSGKWVAYVSDESGRAEVYLQPFPRGGQRTIVSTAGGHAPRWAPDGSRLFYQKGDSLLAVSVRTDPAVEIGTSRLVFEGPYDAGYDVDPHGRGFIMVRRDPPTEQGRVRVVRNWLVELRKLTSEKGS